MPGEINATDLIQFPTSLDATYATALESVAPSITSKITESQAPGETWADTLQRILPMIASTVQQKEILNIQLERAKHGLPPLDNAQFGVGVNVGLSPQLQNMLIFGGIGLVALLMLSGKRGK